MDELAHDGLLLRHHLIVLNLQLLVLLAHRVEFDAPLVRLLIELCLLTEVELLVQLGLLHSLPQLLLQSDACVAHLELPLVLCLQFLPQRLVLSDRIHYRGTETGLLQSLFL